MFLFFFLERKGTTHCVHPSTDSLPIVIRLPGLGIYVYFRQIHFYFSMRRENIRLIELN